jgi:hypothetical protein
MRHLARFCDWFYTHKTAMLKEHMISPVRERAGLGSPPEAFHTNASESINNVIIK